jgi:hypothetical protein
MVSQMTANLGVLLESMCVNVSTIQLVKGVIDVRVVMFSTSGDPGVPDRKTSSAKNATVTGIRTTARTTNKSNRRSYPWISEVNVKVVVCVRIVFTTHMVSTARSANHSSIGPRIRESPTPMPVKPATAILGFQRVYVPKKLDNVNVRRTMLEDIVTGVMKDIIPFQGVCHANVTSTDHYQVNVARKRTLVADVNRALPDQLVTSVDRDTLDSPTVPRVSV